tara:strand:- start:528 stop:1433 length:906 start_codon:yes stop_codon:yes gene_type:complete
MNINYMKPIFKLSTLILSVATLMSCGGNDDDREVQTTLTLNTFNLGELPNNAEYEAWLVSNGENISLGKFNGNASEKTFRVSLERADAATQFLISIEPGNDPSGEISNTILLSGPFSGNSASLNINNAIANLSGISGAYTLMTPTDNNSSNEQSGFYFYNPTSGTAALNLPTLPDGWMYEGWVTLPKQGGGTVNLSTGKFTSPEGRDEFDGYSSNTNTSPSFPGEDFLSTQFLSLQGVSTPVDIRGKKVFISIEPATDPDELTPFYIQPLINNLTGQDLAPAMNTMTVNSASFPQGVVIKE